MRRLVSALALALATLGAALGHAAPPAARAAPTTKPNELRGRVGVTFAKRLLDADDAADRIRGVVRLGAIGTSEAVDALVEAIDQGGPVARDPRARLEAVRALAPFAAKDGVRQLLLRETNDATSDARGVVSPVSPLVRSCAALALAKSGEKKAIAGLIGSVSQGGPAAEAASRALRAHPPASLEAFLEGRKRLTPQLATLLGEIGDTRAIERLRAMLGETDPAGRTAAAVALARLGDEAPLALAREWAKSSEARLKRAAADVLVALGAPDAPAVIAALIGSDATRDDGLKLAAAAPSAELVAPLLIALGKVSDDEKPAVVALLGRSGPRAVPPLVGLLAREALAVHAASALARAPGDDAQKALERALAEAKAAPARRLLARAAVVRALELGETVSGARAVLEALAASRDPADRGVGVFGMVATGAWSLDASVKRACKGTATPGLAERPSGCAIPTLAAAARGALARDPGDLDALAPLLIASAEPAQIAAAGVALLALPGGGEASTTDLATWAEAGGPIAPLAARALPSRDTPSLRGRIKRLLEGSDPSVRAHTALGLALDPEPDAVSLLVQAYRFEDDAGARRAIVRALAHRSEVQRVATLELAAALDPDDGVRMLAAAALAGRPVAIAAAPARAFGAGAQGVAWIEAHPTEPPPRAVPGRLARADGLAIPFVTDADGAALVPGLPSGLASLWLAPEPGREKDPPR